MGAQGIRRLGVRLGLVACLVTTSALGAEERSTRPGHEDGAASGIELSAVTDETASYRIVPGDLLEIRVFEHEALSRTLPVPPSGRMSFPPAGTITLAGRTVEELEEHLTAALQKTEYLANPQVSVVITEYNKRYVYLVEGVEKPQAYELPVDHMLRLTQALSLGGGLVESADRKHVKIFRRSLVRNENGTTVRPDAIVVDLDEIIDSGKTECDVLIHPGDTIVVPDQAKDERQIFVGGKVKKPGAYPLKPQDELTVFRAIILAGGLDKFANPEGTVVIRKTPKGEKAFKLDIPALLKEGLKKDLTLRPNDIVWVPESFFGS